MNYKKKLTSLACVIVSILSLMPMSLSAKMTQKKTSNGFVYYEDGRNIYDYNKKLIIPSSRGYDKVTFERSVVYGGFFMIQKKWYAWSM